LDEGLGVAIVGSGVRIVGADDGLKVGASVGRAVTVRYSTPVLLQWSRTTHVHPEWWTWQQSAAESNIIAASLASSHAAGGSSLLHPVRDRASGCHLPPSQVGAE